MGCVIIAVAAGTANLQPIQEDAEKALDAQVSMKYPSCICAACNADRYACAVGATSRRRTGRRHHAETSRSKFSYIVHVTVHAGFGDARVAATAFPLQLPKPLKLYRQEITTGGEKP